MGLINIKYTFENIAELITSYLLCVCNRNLQEKIEHFVPGDDMTELRDVLKLSKNYITKLDIRQLLPPVREAPKAFQLDDDDAASDAGRYAQCRPNNNSSFCSMTDIK